METAQHHFKILIYDKKKNTKEIWAVFAMFTRSVMFLKQQEVRRRLLLVNTGISLLLQSSPAEWHVLIQR